MLWCCDEWCDEWWLLLLDRFSESVRQQGEDLYSPRWVNQLLGSGLGMGWAGHPIISGWNCSFSLAHLHLTSSHTNALSVYTKGVGPILQLTDDISLFFHVSSEYSCVEGIIPRWSLLGNIVVCFFLNSARLKPPCYVC